jgi:hypothetical protein
MIRHHSKLRIKNTEFAHEDLSQAVLNSISEKDITWRKKLKMFTHMMMQC